MPIKLNGGDDPLSVRVFMNGVESGVTKVVFYSNGTSTTVWEGFPGYIASVSFALSNGSTMTFANCRPNGYSQVITVGGVQKTALSYTGDLTATLKFPAQHTDLGEPGTYNYTWGFSSKGVPSGFTYYSMTVPSATKRVLVDRIGMANVVIANLVGADRSCSALGVADALYLLISEVSGDKRYFSADTSLAFGGKASFYIYKT